LAGTIRKETDWNVMVYNADFAVHSEPWSMSYLSGSGFKSYLRNLTNVSSPIWEEVRLTITEYKPSVVGIYSCAANSVSASMVARLAKEVSRRILVIVGGPHPTAVRADILDDPNIDIIVKGEGERTIVELLDTIKDKGSFDRVRGIVYRDNHRIIETANRELIENLDSLCFPHEYAHEVLKDYDKHPKSAFRNILATRGCPYNCFFCGSRTMWGRKVRFRSVTNVAEEIKSLRRMGIRWIEFVDDTFAIDKEYTNQLCDSMIQNCPGTLWDCETRADLVDEELLVHMKKAGCRSIYLGIESGDDGILRKLRKGITVEKAISAANLIRKHGIRLTAFFIIGTPEETEDSLNDTFMVMQKIRGLLEYSVFTPYPGTEAFEYCRNEGLIPNNYWVAMYNHQSPENCFCKNIQKERFRELASKIEVYVDRHNARQRLKDIFSFYTLHQLQNYGLPWSIEILMNLIHAQSIGSRAN
jgi:radical SAM superfamily enzyme YgiQ (UPF0313 family)